MARKDIAPVYVETEQYKCCYKKEVGVLDKKCLVGLTGQSGAGKSIVAEAFRECGYEVINADDVAHKIQTSEGVVARLVEMFGDTVSADDGALNRKALAEIVFSDKHQLAKLNQFMFPLVLRRVIEIALSSDKKYILLDAPQLLESKAKELCCFTVAVIAPEDVLVDRIVKRDGISKEMAEKRLSCQHTRRFFKRHCDWVIENDSSVDALNELAADVANAVMKYYK